MTRRASFVTLAAMVAMLGVELPNAERGAAGPPGKKPVRDDEPREGEAAGGAPVVESTTDKATGQVQAGGAQPGSASAPQPPTYRTRHVDNPWRPTVNLSREQARRVRQMQRQKKGTT